MTHNMQKKQSGAKSQVGAGGEAARPPRAPKVEGDGGGAGPTACGLGSRSQDERPRNQRFDRENQRFDREKQDFDRAKR